MHANNETGVLQPIAEIAKALTGHNAFFHVDAAQTFGKVIDDLKIPRIDLISVSAHKIYGPKGIGALVTRRREYERLPLAPLTFGGGQERGLRPGTLPVPLIAGLGMAAELASKDHGKRATHCAQIKRDLFAAFEPLEPLINGDQTHCLPNVANFAITDIDSEAFMLAVKDLIAISNGSACTSASYAPSHVLQAMGLPPDRIQGSVRISWCHLTPTVNWPKVVARVAMLKQA